MINRILIRIKVVQLLYSYLLTRSEFRIVTAPEKSTADGRYAHALYLKIMLMIPELAGYRVVPGAKRTPLDSLGSANMLAASQVARALGADLDIREIIARGDTGIESLDDVVLRLYGKITSSVVYTDFRRKRKVELADEIKLWTVLLETVVQKEPLMLEAARRDEGFTLAGYHQAFRMVIDTLNNYYDTNATLRKARTSLDQSLEKTYDLYHALLMLPVYITRLEAERLEAAKEKYCPTPEDLNPNMRFVDNRFVEAIASHPQIDEYGKKHDIAWDTDYFMLKQLLDAIKESQTYKEYMESDGGTLASDCEFWRTLLKNVVFPSDALAEALEEKSIFWNDDLAVMGTFVLKTIRQMATKGNREAPLLPMYKDDEDAEFGARLFDFAVSNREEYRSFIERFINGTQWDPERLALMDIVIMVTAIAELLNFPSIPVPVTMNEYVEIANYYSSPRSGQFINGVLYNVANYLREEGRLLK